MKTFFKFVANILFVFLIFCSLSSSAQLSIELGVDRDSICEGECVTITNKITDAIEPIMFLWDHGSSDVQPEVCPVNTTKYCVIATDANGDTSMGCITIVVNPAPGAPTVVANPNPICEGDTSVLTSSIPLDGWCGVFDSPIGGTLLGTTPMDLLPTDTTTYCVEPYSDKGCPGERKCITVNVIPVPGLPLVTSATPNSICEGDSSVISATGSGLNRNYRIFDSISGGDFLGVAPLTVFPTDTTNYYIDVIDTLTGCNSMGNRKLVTVDVIPIPTPDLNVTVNSNVCYFECIILTCDTSPGVTNCIIYDSLMNELGSNQFDYCLFDTTVFYIENFYSTACLNYSQMVKHVINVDPFHALINSPDSICPDSVLILDGAASSEGKYKWRGSEDFTEIDSSHIEINKPGHYVLSVRTGSCYASDTVIIYEKQICDSPSFASSLSANFKGIEIYPNPANEKIFIKNIELKSIDEVNVFDITGKQILSLSRNGLNLGIDVNGLPEGKYLIQFIGDNVTSTESFIINRLK